MWYWLCSLTDPPRGNSTLHLTVEVINQRGNAIDVTPHVLLDPREKFFTAADYGVQFTSFVNLTGVWLLFLGPTERSLYMCPRVVALHEFGVHVPACGGPS